MPHAYDRRLSAPPAMLVGEVYLETISSGIITQEEIDWLTTHQASFSREEEAMALKLGRLLDEGKIQIGCRLIDTPPEPGAYGPPEQAPTA